MVEPLERLYEYHSQLLKFLRLWKRLHSFRQKLWLVCPGMTLISMHHLFTHIFCPTKRFIYLYTFILPRPFFPLMFNFGVFQSVPSVVGLGWYFCFVLYILIGKLITFKRKKEREPPVLHCFSFDFKTGIPTAWHVNVEWKDFPTVHSHQSCLLLPSWENLRALTPTEIRGCGGYQRHTMTLNS